MFLIGLLTDFSTYTTDGKYVGVPLLSLTLGLVIGFMWELNQVRLGDAIKIGWDDIFRTMVGFLIGGLTSLFF
jgi:hypothetical protein